MSALGLGMIAANNYFNRGDEIQKNDYDQAKRESELSMLPDKMAAERSGYQLRGKQNDANLGLVDIEAAQKTKELELEGKQTQGDLGRVDIENQTKDFDANKTRDSALLSSALAEVDALDLPRAVMLKKQAGVLKEAEAGRVATAHIAQFVHAGDSHGMLEFIKQMSATAPDGKGLSADPVRVDSIQNPDDPKDKLVTLLDKDGNPVLTSQGNAMSYSTKTLNQFLPKGETKVLRPGDTVGTVMEGSFSPSYKAPESQYSMSLAQQTTNQQIEVSRRKLARLDPAEIRRKTQKFTNTGRDNPDFDSALSNHARLASKRKYGEDYWYDQQGEATPADAQSAADRFTADPAMKGFKLGKQTGNVFEVFNSAGKLVGKYE